MENNLTSMVAFVLERDKREEVTREDFIKCRNYAKFLSQPLQLGFFVPCDLDGNVLEEPKFVSPDGVKWEDYILSYQQAKDRVLFEGFKLIYISEIITVVENTSIKSKIIFEPTASMTIEMLCYDNLTLTASALNSLKA